MSSTVDYYEVLAARTPSRYDPFQNTPRKVESSRLNLPGIGVKKQAEEIFPTVRQTNVKALETATNRSYYVAPRYTMDSSLYDCPIKPKYAVKETIKDLVNGPNFTIRTFQEVQLGLQQQYQPQRYTNVQRTNILQTNKLPESTLPQTQYQQYPSQSQNLLGTNLTSQIQQPQLQTQSYPASTYTSTSPHNQPFLAQPQLNVSLTSTLPPQPTYQNQQYAQYNSHYPAFAATTTTADITRTAPRYQQFQPQQYSQFQTQPHQQFQPQQLYQTSQQYLSQPYPFQGYPLTSTYPNQPLQTQYQDYPPQFANYPAQFPVTNIPQQSTFSKLLSGFASRLRGSNP
eukprot:TRINITY_DN11849_c0_g1_i1.p1 TRINITY_DN11849_c0_g1~~TRINITY_DN11849_c0_g1_i1.p1  ORF type:complete len:342 (-),score=44.08 TRINITY_DN11849_c0_g1_i1:21-1046(-)